MHGCCCFCALQLNVAEAEVNPAENVGRDNAIEIATAERKLYVQAKSEEDRDSWLRVLRAASNRHSDGDTGVADVEDVKFDSLPSVVAIAGTLECGAEVKVFAKPPDLTGLTISWFTFTSADINEGNINTVPAERFVAGANLQTYVLREQDVGLYVGCTIKDKPGSGNKAVRVALGRRPISPLDTSFVTCRISLRRHEHNKYCDRKERVRCVACLWSRACWFRWSVYLPCIFFRLVLPDVHRRRFVVFCALRVAFVCRVPVRVSLPAGVHRNRQVQRG